MKKSAPWAAMALVGLFLQVVRAEDVESELAALQGDWLVESFEFSGMSVPEMLGAQRQFSGMKYTLKPSSGETYSGSIKLDTAPLPHHMDLILPDRTLRGIYEIAGQKLKIAYVLEGDARPSSLASPPGSGIVLVVHRRP